MCFETIIIFRFTKYNMVKKSIILCIKSQFYDNLQPPKPTTRALIKRRDVKIMEKLTRRLKRRLSVKKLSKLLHDNIEHIDPGNNDIFIRDFLDRNTCVNEQPEIRKQILQMSSTDDYNEIISKMEKKETLLISIEHEFRKLMLFIYTHKLDLLVEDGLVSWDLLNYGDRSFMKGRLSKLSKRYFSIEVPEMKKKRDFTFRALAKNQLRGSDHVNIRNYPSVILPRSASIILHPVEVMKKYFPESLVALIVQYLLLDSDHLIFSQNEFEP